MHLHVLQKYLLRWYTHHVYRGTLACKNAYCLMFHAKPKQMRVMITYGHWCVPCVHKLWGSSVTLWFYFKWLVSNKITGWSVPLIYCAKNVIPRKQKLLRRPPCDILCWCTMEISPESPNVRSKFWIGIFLYCFANHFHPEEFNSFNWFHPHFFWHSSKLQKLCIESAWKKFIPESLKRIVGWQNP